MRHPAGEIEMNERGVYWARTLSADGFPIAYAVNSHGRRIRSYKVLHPTRAEMALVTLWDVLDTEDPTPESRRAQLRVVRVQLPTTEHRTMLEAYDPYAMPPVGGARRARL